MPELPTRLAALGAGIGREIDVPPIPVVKAWLGRQAADAYRNGFLRGLMGNAATCLFEVVGTCDRGRAAGSAGSAVPIEDARLG